MSTLTPKPGFKPRSIWHQSPHMDDNANLPLEAVPMGLVTCKHLSCCTCHRPKWGAHEVFSKGKPIVGKLHVLSYSSGQETWRLLRALGEIFQFQAVSMLWVILFRIEKNRTVIGNKVKNTPSTVLNSLINILLNPGNKHEYKNNDLILFITYVVCIGCYPGSAGEKWATKNCVGR